MAESHGGNPIAQDVQTSLEQLLPQWQGNPVHVAQQVRELADRTDDPRIAALAALLSSQAGSWQEGVAYATRAADAGYVAALNSVYGQMFSEPARYDEAVDMVQALYAAGWPLDPLAHIMNVVPNGRVDLALKLLSIEPRPKQAATERQAWKRLIRDATKQTKLIDDAVTEVEEAKAHSIDAIKGHESELEAEKERMDALVAELADLANDGASRHLGKEYSAHAEKEEDSASAYTTAAIVVGGIAALASCAIAYLAFTHEHGTGAVLTKAALALPILAFAGYLARLASIHRKQAWRWRHIELQIRSVRSFVAPLDETQRRVLVAALALRFFPGQDTENSERPGESLNGLRDLISGPTEKDNAPI